MTRKYRIHAAILYLNVISGAWIGKKTSVFKKLKASVKLKAAVSPD